MANPSRRISHDELEETLKNLSTEEKAALRRCQVNGFIFGTVLGTGWYGLSQILSQYFNTKKPSVQGSAASFVVNLIVGYCMYASVCATKIIRPKLGNDSFLKKEDLSTSELPLSLEDYKNFQSTLNPDLDGPDSTFSHLSVGYEPANVDGLILEDEEAATHKPKFLTTYEDLRRQNREKYRIKNLATENTVQGLQQPDKEMIPRHTEPPKRIRTNQYGDPVE